MSEISTSPAAPPVTTDFASCRNCGAQASGVFCPACGQKTDTSIPTLAEFLGDFLHDLFNFDSRIWRTLGVLLFRPGQLTLAYLAGQRARYVPPMRLYLVTSVIMFLIFALPDGRPDDSNTSDVDVDVDVEVDGTIDDPDPNPNLEELIAASVTSGLPTGDQQTCNLDLDWLENTASGQQLLDKCKLAQNDTAVMAGLLNTFRDNLPLLSFLIIPLMAAIFKLFYVFSGRAYLEHLAFLTHNHALLLCFLGIMNLFQRIDDALPVLSVPVQLISLLLPMIYLPVYFIISLRRVYQQHFALTLLKFSVLMLVYVVVAAFVFLLGFLATLFQV